MLDVDSPSLSVDRFLTQPSHENFNSQTVNRDNLSCEHGDELLPEK